ncbi:MAG: CPBP family intramembrane metalloprotease [Firmicutes bacterium]|nr:CPBP family intramembrane metalloprotease [Bacillota bacterium]
MKNINKTTLIILITYLSFIILTPILTNSLDSTTKILFGLFGFSIINLISYFFNKNLKKGLICLYIYIFLSLFLDIILISLNIFNEITISYLSPIIIILTIIYFNKEELINKFYDFKNNFSTYLKTGFNLWFKGLLLMMLFNLIINLFIMKNIPINETQNRDLISNQLFYSIFSILIVAPLLEELVFRASFKNSFNNYFHYSLYTGIIFGLIHVLFAGDYIYSLSYAALGFYLGKIYYETDNIYVSMFMHFFHNLFSLCLILNGGF